MNYLQAIDRLPEADDPIEVLITIQVLLRNLGIELADRYDKKLTQDIGPEWFEALQNLRQTPLTMIDPQFVLSEPLKNPDSPTRNCLPHGRAFYDKLEAALRVRNSWSHHEYYELSLKELYPSVSTLQDFAKEAGMALANRCKKVKLRIEQIQNGSYTAGVIESKPSLLIQLEQMELALAEASKREQKANEDILAAQELLDQAANKDQTSTDPADLAAQTELEEALAKALEDKKQLEYLVESLAVAADSHAPTREADQIGFGHKWQGTIPARKVKLVSLKNDLFDDELKKFVAEEFGPTAETAIAKIRSLVPVNSTIYLSEQGKAVAYLNGDPIFVGSLIEISANSEGNVSGFFSPNNYVLRINGDIEDMKTGQTLREAIGESAVNIGSDLILLRPSGGLLKVTTEGLIASRVRGEWLPLSKVHPKDWFTGHL